MAKVEVTVAAAAAATVADLEVTLPRLLDSRNGCVRD